MRLLDLLVAKVFGKYRHVRSLPVIVDCSLTVSLSRALKGRTRLSGMTG